MEPQIIPVPLEVGSRVVLYGDVDLEEEGAAIDITYEATVEQYVPETRLIRMSDGTGRAELLRLFDEASGFEVIKDASEQLSGSETNGEL